MPGFLEILFELNWMFLSQDCLLVVHPAGLFLPSRTEDLPKVYCIFREPRFL